MATCYVACTSSCTGSCSSSCSKGCTGTCVTCTGCKGTCGGGCKGCTGDCTGTCATGCAAHCNGDCRTTCTRTCGTGCGYCSGCSGCGGCSSSCSGSCRDVCNDGCTGQNMTVVYNNMVLGTIIKASEISDLGNLIRNELTRRSKSPTTTENVAVIDNSVLAATINNFYTDLKAADSSIDITNPATEDIVLKDILNKYIENVKKLYSTKVDK